MTDKRNILILTSDAGLGHRSAAEAIAAALVNGYGDECAIAVVNPAEDEQAPGFLRVSDTAVPASVIESALTVMLFGVICGRTQRRGESQGCPLRFRGHLLLA